MANFTLRFTSRLGKVEQIQLNSDQPSSVIFGRSANAAISFSGESTISSQHAQLSIDAKGSVFIVDLNSTNGTFLNGQKLVPNQPHEITAADLVYFTSSRIVELRFDGSAIDPIAEHPFRDLFDQKDTIIIGRSAESDYRINHPSVSRKHASIVKLQGNKGEFSIKDLGSLNGTYVNGTRINGVVKVTAKDVIYIGRFQLDLLGNAIDISTEVAIKAIKVEKVFPNGKKGLHTCSFDIPEKSLTAIMGPSGCGKSTLLKALNGDSPQTSGEVFISGLSLKENFNYLKTQIGYVPQDDIVHKELTVEECLWYAAKLKLTGASNESIRQKIAQVMADLNIDEIKNNLVGKISGGQRKRVSIATEILTDPLILFLDEPTSPLDPQTIDEFLKILKSLATRGTAIVMVTHKPEDLDYMDHVIFMAEGGHLVFQGEANKYLEHFGTSNTIEVYVQLVDPNSTQWIELYRKNEKEIISNPEVKSGRPNKKSTNALSQYFWLTRRYFNIKLNDKLNTLILIGQAPIIAILIGLIFDKVSPAVTFIMAVSAIWFGTSNAAREIVSEAPIYKRERMFNQGIWPYLFSKITVLTLFSLLQTTLFVAIISISFSGYDIKWNNIENSFLILSLISLTSTVFGLFLSTLMSNTEKVMAVVPITLIPQIMLSGLITKINVFAVEILSYFTISRWGNELLNINQKELVVEVSTPGVSLTQNQTVDAAQYIKNQYHNDYSTNFGAWSSTWQLDTLALTSMILLLLVFTYVLMKRKDPIQIK